MTTVDRPTAQGWVADDSTFGARLALVRQHMRWGNVKEAATACGLPVESWRSWERDGRAPQRLVDIAAIIADKTGCDYGWLLAGPRLNRTDRDLNPAWAGADHKDDPERVPHVAPRPFSPMRRDRSRPISAIPATRRRPTPVRPGQRPMREAS